MTKAKIDREQILGLFRDGYSDDEIAKLLSCHVTTSQRIRREFPELRVEDPEDDQLEDEDETPRPEPVVATPGPGAEDVTAQKNATAKRRAEVEEERLLLELDRIKAERQSMGGVGGFDRIAALLQPQPAPPQQSTSTEQLVLQMLMQQNQQLTQQLAAQQAQPLAPVVGSQLAELFPLFTGMVKLVKGLQTEAVAAPETTMVGDVANLLQSMKQPTAPTGAVEVAPQPAPAVPQLELPGRISAGVGGTDGDPLFAEIRRRVGVFLQFVEREMAIGSDPYTAADELDQLVGSLPEPLRKALQSQPLIVVITEIRNYLPPEDVERFTNLIAVEANATWLGQLLHALRQPAEDEEADTTDDRMLDAVPTTYLDNNGASL